VAAVVSALRSRRLDVPTTTAGGVLVGAALVALVLVLVPGSPDRIPADVPADLIWDFRLASLGQLAVLWATLTLAAGWLVDRGTRSP
jgi:predicted cobalt transporter CbtA